VARPGQLLIDPDAARTIRVMYRWLVDEQRAPELPGRSVPLPRGDTGPNLL
jgi:hypothetical protein